MKIYQDFKSILTGSLLPDASARRPYLGRRWCTAGLAALIVAAGVSVCRGQAPSFVEFDSFDNASQVTPFAFNDSNGVSAATNEWDSVDSQGIPTSGSMKVVIGYSKTAQGCIYQYNLPSATNLSAYTALEFDVKVDPSTPLDGNGNATALQPGVATSGSGYNAIYMTLKAVTTNNGWQHIIVPASMIGGANWNELTGMFFQIADYNETSNVTAVMWFDNIRFTSTTPGLLFPNYTNANLQFNDSNFPASIYGNNNVGTWFGNGATVTWSTNDSHGYTNSGSIYVSATFESGNNVILGIPFDTNYASEFGATDTNSVINAYNFTNIELDVLWDSSNSTIGIDAFNAAGDIGGFPIGIIDNPNTGQLEICGSPTTFIPDAASNSWQHISCPIIPADLAPAAEQTIGLYFKKYYNGSAGTGTVAFWVDNVTFDGGVIPKPTAQYPSLSLAPTVPGVQIQFTGGTSGNAEYDREHLATSVGTYSFVGAPSPVTYSVTYASIPPTLPPATYACVDFDPTEGTTAEEDWDDPTLFRIQIVRSTNVSGFGSSVGSLVTLQCKTNSADANGDLYDASDPTWTNASNPEGTWTFTISGNTNIQITAPDNETKNLPFPLSLTSAEVADASLFGTGSMYVYFGAQCNGSAGQGSRYVISACSISGGGLTGFTENFAAEAAAGDPGPQGTLAAPAGTGTTWTPVIAGAGANAITWYVAGDTSETYNTVQGGVTGTLSKSIYLLGPSSTPFTLNWTDNVAPGFAVMTNTVLTEGDFGSNGDLTASAYLDANHFSVDVTTNDLPPAGVNWFVELEQ
jgi:hypothetical protein